MWRVPLSIASLIASTAPVRGRVTEKKKISGEKKKKKKKKSPSQEAKKKKGVVDKGFFGGVCLWLYPKTFFVLLFLRAHEIGEFRAEETHCGGVQAHSPHTAHTHTCLLSMCGELHQQQALQLILIRWFSKERERHTHTHTSHVTQRRCSKRAMQDAQESDAENLGRFVGREKVEEVGCFGISHRQTVTKLSRFCNIFVCVCVCCVCRVGLSSNGVRERAGKEQGKSKQKQRGEQKRRW